MQITAIRLLPGILEVKVVYCGSPDLHTGYDRLVRPNYHGVNNINE